MSLLSVPVTPDAKLRLQPRGWARASPCSLSTQQTLERYPATQLLGASAKVISSVRSTR